LTFVLDASVTLGWLLPDEQDPYPQTILQRLAGESAIVSNVWPLEVANGLLVAERRGRVSATDATVVHTRLRELPIIIEPASLDSALRAVFALARTHNLSAYDAAYLELAMREGIALATSDDRLRAAALAAGVLLAE
jgi:predicted nucleic acid-binding protein